MHKRLALLLAVALCLWACPGLAEGVSIAGYDGGSSTTHDWNTNLFFVRMEERTGISLSFQQYTEYDAWTQAKSAMLSSGAELPDVLFKAELTTAETQALYEAGKLIDLRPYLEEYAPNLSALLAAHPDWEQAITLPDGAIVALPMINELQNNNAMWINRAWLDKLGLSMPTTAQELTEVLRAFRDNDPNGNGKQDEIPLAFLGMWDLRFLGHAFGLVADDYNLYLDADGTVRTTLTTDENRAFLTWLNQLWSERLLDRNGFTTSDTIRRITDSKAAITFGVMLAPTPLSLVPVTAMDQYELLMPLTYNGTQSYRDLLGSVVRGAFAITSACEDPAAMVAWVDFLYTEEGSRLAQAGLEGVEYQYASDGTWNWIAAAEEVVATVLPNATMADGGTLPGLVSVDFQLAFDQAETRALTQQLRELKAVSTRPMPLAYFTPEQQARLDDIQLDLGGYAERAMIHFVTGDVALDDDAWQDFCRNVANKGIDELIAIWQDAIQ